MLRVQKAVAQFIDRLVIRQDGSMTVFALVLLSMMLLLGGMAVDIMRFETNRARLQATLDRAVLAAADLSVCLDPSQDTEAIVEDFVAKAGFEDQLQQIVVVQEFNSCAVSATAELGVNTIFLSNVGVDRLVTGAASTATEAMNEAEISLVVDISGSMGSGGRIEALRPAATSFVNTIFGSFNNGSVSMSLVPYSTQVSVGEDVIDAFSNIHHDHSYSHCIEFDNSAYNRPGLNMNQQYRQAAHIDADSFSYNRNYWGASRFVCDPNPNSEAILHADTPGPITARINALRPYEWTSIEMGAKWGVALLDPSTQDITDHLSSLGQINASVADRPLPYGENNSLKIMVLMTDGENTQSYELDNAYRFGPSDVYLDDNTGLYYVDDRENGKRDGDNITNEKYYRPNYDDWTNNLPGSARQLDWTELFSRINLDGHAWYFRHEQGSNNNAYNFWYNNFFRTTYQDEKNERLISVCDEAKEEGIIIFTIGFQVPSGSQSIMEQCASSPSYYYDVDDLDIDEAFSSIASQISALRLIQ